MGLFGKIFGSFSARGGALSKYKSGMTKAKAGKYDAAIADYTSAIDGKKTPSDVKAMALYNRSLAYTSSGDSVMAARDLDTIIKMDNVPHNIMQQAAERQQRMRKKTKVKSPTI